MSDEDASNANPNTDDVLDQLKAANPFSAGDSSPQPTTSRSALFEEIAMSDYETTPSSRRDPAAALPWWRRKVVALPAMAAMVAMLAVGALIASTATAPSAYALATSAAQNAATYDSGRVVVEIDLRTLPDEPAEAGTFQINYAYSGTDYSLQYDMSGMEFEGSLGDDANMEIRRVGDLTYNTFFSTDGGWVSVPVDETMNTGDLGFDIHPESITPSSIVPLIEQADDFSKVSSDDGVTVYRGSMQTTALNGMDTRDLPPGIALLAGGDDANDDLPETLELEVTVDGDQLTAISVLIEGDTPTGYVDATISSTFLDLGEPQNIVAPPADQVTPFDQTDPMFGMPEGMEEALAVMEDLDERRPGLCQEIFEDIEANEVEGPEDFAQTSEDFVKCLEDAGEPEAADAFRTMTQFDN